LITELDKIIKTNEGNVK